MIILTLILILILIPILTTTSAQTQNRDANRLLVHRGDVNSKMLSSLLTGISRASPYASLSEDTQNDFSEHIGTLYRIMHTTSFNKSVMSLQVLFHAMCAAKVLFYFILFYCYWYYYYCYCWVFMWARTVKYYYIFYFLYLKHSFKDILILNTKPFTPVINPFPYL